MSKSSKNVSMSVSNDKLLTFEVIPDVGLKSDKVEFVLGMPLNQVLTILQKNAMLLKQVNLKYSKKTPLHKDISVYIPEDGIQLIFDGVTQLAKLIQVDNLSNIVLKYGSATFSEPGAEASMEKVNECFGSTHPGAYDEKQKMYVQSWPGLSFCFPTNSSEKIEVAPGFGPNLRSLKYDANSQPILTKMSIYRGNNLSQPEQVDIPFVCYCGQNRTRQVDAIREDGVIVGLNVCFDTQNGSKVDGDLEVFTVKREVYFGDSVATVQSAFGAPSKIYYKSDDKMKIHRGATKETLGGQSHFFFNYFNMGFDILFDFVSKRVIKFVLHSNAPGHPDFGLYSRCNFTIPLEKQIIETDSKFSEFSSTFSEHGIEPRPVDLRRLEPHSFGAAFCYGTHQIIVEVMENGYIAAVTLYEENL